MVQRVSTVAFEGIEVRPVDVQVRVAAGLPAFNVVGLPDKAVSEARERVRSALTASGLALPARRITINLAPADVPKEGSHYNLPIALGLMAAIGAIRTTRCRASPSSANSALMDRSHRWREFCPRPSALMPAAKAWSVRRAAGRKPLGRARKLRSS